MKISVLMGSLRKKDSFSICKNIESIMKMNEDVEYEYIFLDKYNIMSCKGCGICLKRDENLCPCKDDLNIIKSKLLKSDGIIIATPVYAYQIPGSLKNIVDRMSYLFHRQELVGKPVFLVVTSDGGGYKKVIKYIKMVLSCWGCDFCGFVNIISPKYFKNKKDDIGWGYDERYSKSINKNIEISSNIFIKTIKAEFFKVPSYYEILMFNCLRTKTFTSQADYNYWYLKGWLNSYYFYNVNLGFFKKIFSITIRQIIEMLGKKLKNRVSTYKKI